MTNNILTGADALSAMDAGSEETVKNEFTRLKSGGSFTVKVPGLHVISAFVYGNYENPSIYSFVSENESKKSAKGFPVENLTPFDKAWKHYKDQSDDWLDEMSAKAGVYKSDQKFTYGFFDLDEGKPVAIEFTRNQAIVIRDAIIKNEKYLDKFAFELTKKGTGTNTVVGLSLIPMLDDLTEKQQKNFAELPSEFDANNFEGLYYVMNDEEQMETLTRVGFDLSLIGLAMPETSGEGTDAEPVDIDEKEFPF